MEFSARSKLDPALPTHSKTPSVLGVDFRLGILSKDNEIVPVQVTKPPLAYAIGWFLTFLIFSTPITHRLSHWYGAQCLFVLLFIVALALYGFRSALAGRPFSAP